MRSPRGYRFTICILAVLAMSCCIAFLTTRYTSLIDFALRVTQKRYLEAMLRSRVFPESKYDLLRTLSKLMLLLIPLAALALIRWRARISGFVSFTAYTIRAHWESLRAAYKGHSGAERTAIRLVFFAAAVRSVYYIVTRDPQYDEMWSYNYFSAQPLYFPLVVSSNYPLYAFVSGFFSRLPFPMILNLRLPVLLGGLASGYILYPCLKRFFNGHIPALAGLVVFFFMPVSTFYMLYARGIMLEMGCAIVAIFSLLFWLRDRAPGRLIIHALANIIGMYAMPTHIYLWAALLIFGWLMTRNRPATRALLTGALITVTGLLVLYAPMIAGSGISFLLEAGDGRTGRSLAPADIWFYHWSSSVFFAGVAEGFFWLVPAAAIMLYATKARGEAWRFFSLCCVLCLLPTLVVWIQNVMITPRAFSFAALTIPCFIAVLFTAGNMRGRPILVSALILAIGIAGALLSDRQSAMQWSRASDRAVRSLSERLLKKNVRTVYDNSHSGNITYAYPAMEYYYRLSKKNFILTTADSGSLRFKPYRAADRYDCVIESFPKGSGFAGYHDLPGDTGSDYRVWIRDDLDLQPKE